MEKIFEKYRDFLENADLLLVEGRKDVAMSRAVRGVKNEMIKEFAEVQMQRLLDADPSGKQKYANWLAGQINKEVFRSMEYIKRQRMAVEDYIDSVKASVETVVRRLLSNLPTYHKLVERNLIEKNINKYEEYTDWGHDIYVAEREFQERERLKGMEAEAKQTIDTLINDEDYTLKRPDSTAASCILGMGAQWCIAATRSQNYFDQFTREGKAFYILELRHLPIDDDFRKVALQYDAGRDRESAEPDLIWHSPNEMQDDDDVRSAIRSNLLMKGFWNSQENLKASKKYYNKGKRGDENRQELDTILLNLNNQLDKYQMAHIADDGEIQTRPEILKNLETYMKAADLDGDDLDDLIESLDELVWEEWSTITYSASEHFENHPTGVSDADYEKAIAEAELKHFDVYVDRAVDGEGNDYINAGGSFDFDHDDLVDQNLEMSEVENFLSKALNDENVWNVETYSDNSETSVSVTMHQNEYYDDDPLERFNSFIRDVKEADDAYEEVHKAVIQAMKDSGMIASESLKAIFKRFEEREFKHFEAEYEEGNVVVSSRIPVRLLLPEELTSKSRYLSKELPRPKTSEDPRSFIWDFMIGQLRGTESIERIKADLIKRLNVVFNRALQMAANQLKLPLNEQEIVKSRVPEFKIDFGAMGPANQASIPPKQTSGSSTWDIRDIFTYWLDIVLKGNETPDELAQIEKFLNIIDNEKFFQSIRQYVEALVNNQLQKEIIPAARILVKDTISKEETTDELADLFENWRRFIK